MRRVLLVMTVALAACSASGADEAASTTIAPTSTASTSRQATATAPSTIPGTTTTTVPRELVLYDYWKGSFTYGEGIRIDVHAPEVRSNHPVAVTIHGGGWFTGDLDSMGFLADGLAARGFVVFNATYRTLSRGGTFPSMVEDVACAVAYARDHALDYSTTADHLTLIGHSAGAHLSALVALAPQEFGTACEGADQSVDAWVGLAGSYDTDLYAFLLEPFFGVRYADDPELWAQGRPHTYVSDAPEDVDLLFVHGDADELVPVGMSEDLYLAADRAGLEAQLQVLPGIGHGEVNSPRVVADLVTELVSADR